MKKIRSRIAGALSAVLLLCSPVLTPLAAQEEAVSYDQVADSSQMAPAVTIGKYGMLPIYGRDIRDGTWPIEMESSSRMFRAEKAELTVKDGQMEAAVTLSGTGYLKLFPGTGAQAAAADESAYIGYTEDPDGRYVYTIPVEALDRELPCAAFSTKKQQWYDRTILFDASTLPEEALLLELPDYEKIEAALAAYEAEDAEIPKTDSDASSETESTEIRETVSDAASVTESTETQAADSDASSVTESTETQAADSDASSVTESTETQAAAPMSVGLADGRYSIDVALSGGSGKAFVSSPAYLIIREGRAYARLQWSSANYDYMIVGTEKYLNLDPEGASSVFEIPIAAMDTELPVIADTTAMGTPHEVSYTLTFYSDTIGSASQMPQEAAKRVVIAALIIILAGGILNHFLKKRRSC